MVPALAPTAAGRGGPMAAVPAPAPMAAGRGGPTAVVPAPAPTAAVPEWSRIVPAVCSFRLLANFQVFGVCPGTSWRQGASWHLPLLEPLIQWGVGVVTVSEEEGLSDGTLLNELKIREMTT